MKKIHILRWSSTGRISGVYLSHDKAMWAAKKANLRRKRWRIWLDQAFTGEDSKWEVKTFEIID